MKHKIYYTIAFLALCNTLLAQTFTSKIKVEYKMSTFFSGSYEDYSATLYANEDQSRFEYAIKDTVQNKEIDVAESETNTYEFNFKVKDTSQNIIFIKKSDRMLYNQVMSTKNRLAISEQLPAIDWKFTPDEKMIGSFACKKATAQFRGRTYTAWYAESIPVSIGPWKLGGLPGLILEASDATGEVHFSASKVVLPFKSEVAYLDPAIKKVDRAQSQKLVEEKMADMKKKIQSTGSRGVSVKVSSMKVNKGIELE